MIELISSLHWREPMWLALALVPLVFIIWRRNHRSCLLRYADAELLPWAARLPAAGAAFSVRGVVHALAWLLLAVAAAGPRTPLVLHDGEITPRHRVTVMLAVDVSASMRATDLTPDRLTRARLELLDWLARLSGERVGIIAYAGEAGLLMPPTDDLALLRRALDQIDPSLIESPGSHVGAALDLARVQLEQAPGAAKAVLLVTDADTADAAAGQAVDALVKAGWPLFVLAVGSEAGAPVPLPEGGFAEQDGVKVTSRMNPAPYREWARATGGRFEAARDGDGDWAALHDGGIAAIPGDATAPGEAPAWRELYAWALVPALALLMAVSLPRRALAMAVLVALGGMSAPPPAMADIGQAWQAWQAQRYADAQTLYGKVGGYRGHMGAGASAWRQADFASAARHFGAALLLAGDDRQRADALYNLGNAHYGMRQYAVAIEAFEAVLHVRPGDAKAQTNLGWARLRQSRQRAQDPMKSDLRARRGSLAEGQIDTERDIGLRWEENKSEPAGVQVDRRSDTAAEARATGAAPAAQVVTVDPRLAVSGLKKLERVQDRPDAMLKNLLKQDARQDGTERPPW